MPIKKIIVPLLLIPFIENAFIFGVSPEESSRLDIDITINQSELSLFVSNSKVYTGGLEEDKLVINKHNVVKKLELFYPGSYTLSVNYKNDEYVVTLKLTL